MNQKNWKIGELAKQTGLTVRTLYHYDQIGLLSPSQYSDIGHRLYTETDIARLQQIMWLKQLGFSLEQIKEFIENANFNPIEVIKVQLESLNEHIRIQEQQRSQLEEIFELINSRKDVQAKQFIKLIEVLQMDVHNFFTEEQLEKIRNLGKQLGPQKIKELENEWHKLIVKLGAELEKGTPYRNPEVVQWAKQWVKIVDQFSGGDPELTKASECIFIKNPNNARVHKYIGKALSQI